MNILQLLTYPIEKPMHGGQIRSAEIKKHLIANGADVVSVAVYESLFTDIGEHDIMFDPNSKFHDPKFAKVMDYLSGEYLMNTPSAFSKIEALSKQHKVNVILVEGPWLFYSAQKLANILQAKLIYSSHNIEFRLKKTLLEDDKGPKAMLYLEKIRQLEEDAITQSDLVIACTKSDQEYMQALIQEKGGTHSVIMSGNAVSPFDVEEEEVEKWIKYFKNPFPIFVGSGHPPNAIGFWNMLSPGLTFLRPDQEVVVAGGVCDSLFGEGVKGGLKFAELNRSRLHNLGKVETDFLRATILASHLVILPITDGEGSNLKTAEALESGRPIVATTKAFRGYEDAMSLPHVYIEDNPVQFRKRIVELLQKPRYIGGTPLYVRKKYHWDTQLGGVFSKLKTLIEN